MCRTKDLKYLLQDKKTEEEAIKSLGMDLQRLREDSLVTDSADRGKIGEEIERINAERERRIRKVEDIDLNLSNVSSEGICEDCHKPIPEERLEAQHGPRYCAPCQLIRDRKRKNGLVREPAYFLSPR